MCGIIAYLGRQVGSKYILEGIKILRNRGYDSMGCCSLSNNCQFQITKYANQLEKDSYELLEDNFSVHEEKTCLMAHCRWATTGIVNDINSHPHVDTLTQNLAIVHNGIINNYLELKEFLESKNVKFHSETDTEVIVNLISYYYQQTKNLMDAIKLTLQELDGSWALIIMDQTDPNTMYVSKKGSPIVVGYSDEMCIVSSEVSGFSNYLRNYHPIPDDHILKISFENNKIRFYRDEKLTELSTHTLIHQTLHATTPDPFPHWTLKEIHEQPEAAFRALNQGGRIMNSIRVKLGGLNEYAQTLIEIKHLTIIASGTSGHAGMLGQKYFQAISGFESVRMIDASEFILADLSKDHAGVLLLSQSGETRDVHHCMEVIREARPDVIIFSVVNVVESLIAREADCGIYLNAGREVGVASTKSFTNQVVVLILLSIWFAQGRDLCRGLRHKIIHSLYNMQDLIQKTLNSMNDRCQMVVEYLSSQQHLFILGREKGLPVAREGALKIKEISYIHAEAYSGGSLKHGPLALITNGVPIIIIRMGTRDIITKMDIAAEETKARGGYLISISPELCQNRDLYDHEIVVPNDPNLAPILCTIPMQYLAYLLSVKLGHNPDYPRNLAKCVTVL